jgi:hypothetical protein
VKQKLKQITRADADATFLKNLKPLMVCLLFWMFLAPSFDGKSLYISAYFQRQGRRRLCEED